MAFLNLLLALLITFFTLPLGQAQLISTVPTPTFFATTVVTIPEESFYTTFVQAVSTFTAATTIDGTAALAVETQVVVGGIQESDITFSQGYIINNFSEEDYALCWFPTSGNWALLPRVIFYGTIVFALVARAHEWLVAGALAASLTFSGVAAIQLCLQVWTRQMVAELDFFALLGILSTSCIIAMPLLNWSSTIRYLGQSEPDKRARLRRDMQMKEKRQELKSFHQEASYIEPYHEKKHENYGPTRTVIAFWAVLVAVGFLSGFAALILLKFSNVDYISITANSGVDSIRCVPDNGTMDLSAGQFEHWSEFWVTAEFVSANHCENPCTALPDGQWTLFRAPEKDLSILSAKQIDNLLYQTATSHRERRALEFTNGYYSYMLVSLPIIVIQGLFHFFLFRKHSPQDARQRIYLEIVGENNPEKAHPFVRGFALTISLLFYFFAVLILVLTPFNLVLNVVATELFMYIFPQSEYNKHVGQWGIAASTLLVLLAAMLCRHDAGAWHFYLEVKRAVGKSFSRLRGCCGGRKHSSYQKQVDAEIDPSSMQQKAVWKPHKAFLKIFTDLLRAIRNFFLDTLDYLMWILRDFIGLVAHEWMLFKLFWDNPAITPPDTLVCREKPEMPKSRRVVEKSSNNGEPLEESLAYPVVRYELREDYPMRDVSGNGIKTFSYLSDGRTISMNEAERPFLTHPNPSNSNIVLQPNHSQALSKQEPAYNEASTEITPQSPLLSPPIQHNNHFYRPVASQDNSPNLTMDSNPTTPKPHLLSDGPFQSPTKPTTVMGSLTNSIATRQRRSDIYSPAPEKLTQDTPPLPQHSPILTLNSSPKPDLLKDLPQTPATTTSAAQSLYLPSMSTRTSNLFSGDEIADLYKNGTPQINSMTASRDSMVPAPLNPNLSAEARGIAGTGRVSYLQIQAGRDLSEADAWGDQLMLRRDRYGRWVVVDAPNAVELPAGRISEADDEGEMEEIQPREW